jgi:hypothetical protein
MRRIAARDGMVLKLAKVARKSDMLGARNPLVAEEEHSVPEQMRLDLRDKLWLARGDA